MSSLRGALITERFTFDDGRQVTAYVPPDPADAVVYAADGRRHTERLATALEGSSEESTMVVSVHGLDDDDGRLQEYVEAFGGERFEAYERFFVEDLRSWMRSDLDVALPAERIAVWGASLGGEFALAMGLRHPDNYGVVFCASPGGGFTPASDDLPSSIPRLPDRRQAGTVVPRQCEQVGRRTERQGRRCLDRGTERRTRRRVLVRRVPLMVSWAFRR